jgi:glycosyltransferase involved in cell wall biosynthesis
MASVLWFNWRDITNPEAGGAEVLTHEIAKRLVSRWNYGITLFTSYFHNSSKQEYIDGIKIVRQGGKYGVYRKAEKYYKENKGEFDLVIDEINVRPFLTPKFVKGEKPIVALIHQISPEQFLLELPFPLSYLGRYYFEKKWLSYYRNIPTVTVSSSSKKDLEGLGFRRVCVMPEGLSVKPQDSVGQKEPSPTLAFIGRLKKHKLPHHAILAFSSIKKKIPDAKLWVIGDGYMRKKLETKFKVKDVIFFGHVDTELKYNLLSRAHLVMVPAIREGWALVVTESNAVGTPVIAYDVPGLRDSVRDGKTGMLVKDNSPESLAASAVNLLQKHDLLQEYSSNSLSFSRQFSWDLSASIFEKQVKDAITSSNRKY